MATRKYDVKGEEEFEITTVTEITVGCREANGHRKTEMFFREEFSPADSDKIVPGSKFKHVHGYFEENGQLVRFSTLQFNGSSWGRTKKVEEKVEVGV